jgi:phage regulator Rha-like protein
MYELVELKGNDVFTNSKVIADGTNNQHESVVAIIRKYEKDILDFGNIDFSDLKSGKRGQPERVYYLNEEQATDKNLELYDRESKALIYADQLEKEKNILVKEKREHEKKIEKLERENEQLKEELAKITERKNFSNDPEWRVLKAAGENKKTK